MMTSSIFSKGLYSNWCYNQTHQILFDCGEGAATHIGNSLNGIETIWLTHDHGDHTLGLPSVIGCRNAGRGISRHADTMDSNKALRIFYPADNKLMKDLIEFIACRYHGWLRYEIDTIPVDAHFKMQLNDTTWMEAVPMRHQKGQATYGAVIFEKRTRLAREFRGMSGQELKALKDKGVNVNETYRANLFAYCLDSAEIYNPEQIRNCEQVVMDCTFLDAKDRTDFTHFTLDEARSLCQSMGVKNMLAAHFSNRNDFNKAVKDHPDVRFVNPFVVNQI